MKFSLSLFFNFLSLKIVSTFVDTIYVSQLSDLGVWNWLVSTLDTNHAIERKNRHLNAQQYRFRYRLQCVDWEPYYRFPRQNTRFVWRLERRPALPVPASKPVSDSVLPHT